MFDHIVDRLSALDLVYRYVIEGATGGPRDIPPFDYGSLRRRFAQAYLANNGYTLDVSRQAANAGDADLIASGQAFIANPDLVERLKQGAPLAEIDKDTLYGGGADRYSDYRLVASLRAAFGDPPYWQRSLQQSWWHPSLVLCANDNAAREGGVMICVVGCGDRIKPSSYIDCCKGVGYVTFRLSWGRHDLHPVIPELSPISRLRPLVAPRDDRAASAAICAVDAVEA